MLEKNIFCVVEKKIICVVEKKNGFALLIYNVIIR